MRLASEEEEDEEEDEEGEREREKKNIDFYLKIVVYKRHVPLDPV